MVPDKKTHDSPIYGKVTSTKAFQISIADLNFVKYSDFRKKYYDILRCYDYLLDTKTNVMYFYIPEDRILDIKGLLKMAKLKKEFKEFLV